MSYKVLESIQNQDQNKLREQFALDVLIGLSASKKSLPSMYLYDARGSELFSAICDQPEYYPTNMETQIFDQFREEIVSTMAAGDKLNLIELGAGDGRKVKILLKEFLKQKVSLTYSPIDISEQAVKGLVENLTEEMPELAVEGIVGEYMDALEASVEDSKAKNVVFFLGSNIGNFSKASALQFLKKAWNHLNDKDLFFIGFDLKKDISILNKAYNDKAGVTRDFNLNILTRINRELDADFKEDKFYHYGFYNPLIGSMESHLISKEEQSVTIKGVGRAFNFKPFEPIHLEYSHKYLQSEIEFLAENTGFKVLKEFTEKRNYYTNSLWQVSKL